MLPFFAMLLLSPAVEDARPPNQDFSGEWQWESALGDFGLPKEVLSLTLASEGRTIHGVYCDVSASGRNIDCAESGDNTTGTIDQSADEAQIKILTKDDYEIHAAIKILKGGKLSFKLVDQTVGWPDSHRVLTKIRSIPKDRGACVVTAAIDRAHLFSAPRSDHETKSYVLRNEAVFARGWSANKDFLLVTYSGTRSKDLTVWVKCLDFDACPSETPYYRSLPEAKCVESLGVVE